MVDLLTDSAGRIIPAQAAGGTLVMLGTVNVTTTAAALSAQACKLALIQADPDNTNDIFVGDATYQVWQLKPGDSITLPVANTNTVYLKTSTGTATANVGVIT